MTVLMIVVVIVNPIVTAPVTLALASRNSNFGMIIIGTPDQLGLFEILRAMGVIMRFTDHPFVQQ